MLRVLRSGGAAARRLSRVWCLSAAISESQDHAVGGSSSGSESGLLPEIVDDLVAVCISGGIGVLYHMQDHRAGSGRR